MGIHQLPVHVLEALANVEHPQAGTDPALHVLADLAMALCGPARLLQGHLVESAVLGTVLL